MNEERNTQMYLIPANTKKSQLILGFFTPTDLIIFIVGCVISFALLLMIRNIDLITGIILMLPALVGTFLVLPVPHYHNVLQLITNVFNFYTKRRLYYWKGWCIYEKFGENRR